MRTPLATLYSALASPIDHFKTLWRVLEGNENCAIKIDRNGIFAEARVNIAKRGEAILYIPLKELELNDLPSLANPSSSAICPYIILKDELIYYDHTNSPKTSDIVLQYIPSGYSIYHSPHNNEHLLQLLSDLEYECKRIGFSHNDLDIHDIIISDNNQVSIIRNHFATMDGAYDNFDYIRQQLTESSCLNDVTTRYTADDCQLFDPYNGYIRFRKDGLFGYKNVKGKDIIAAKYLWAGDFFERRAIIKTETGYGVIDPKERSIIPPIFDNLALYTNHSIFTYWHEDELHGLDYNGRPLDNADSRIQQILTTPQMFVPQSIATYNPPYEKEDYDW